MKNIIARPRGWGKTKEIIEAAAKDGGLIITPSEKDAADVQRMADKMGLRILKPVSVFGVMKGEHLGRGIEKVHFDDLDYALRILTGAEVGTVTFTTNAEPIEKKP